jgi:hypothetical protein
MSEEIRVKFCIGGKTKYFGQSNKSTSSMQQLITGLWFVDRLTTANSTATTT